MRNMKSVRIIILLAMVLLVCPSAVMGALTIPQSIEFQSGSDTVSIPLALDIADAGLSGYKMIFTVEKPEVAMISRVDIPDWASLKSVDGGLPSASVTISAVDLDDKLKPGASGVLLATVVLNKTGEGSTAYTLTVKDLTDDNGNLIAVSSPVQGTISTDGSVSPVPVTSQVPSPVPTASQEPVNPAVPMVTPTQAQAPQTPDEPSAPEPEIKPVPTVKADFYSDVVSGTAPITISFTDNSTGYPDRFLWDFGDKSSDSTSVVQNPQHTYRIPGIFSVTLSASNGQYHDTVVKENFISVRNLSSGIKPGENVTTTISSVPGKAEIYLDNAFFGLSPVTINNITPRNYQLRLHKDGYYDTVQTIITNKGVLPTYISGFELLPHPAEIGSPVAQPPKTGAAYIVSYPEMVNLSIDNIPVGKTDIMVTNLPIGMHNLTLNKKGFEAWNDTLEIKNGLTVIQSYVYEEPYFPLNRTVEYVPTP